MSRRGRRIGYIGGVALAAIMCTGLAVVPASAQEADLPVPYGVLATVLGTAAGPTADPPGANDYDCEPSAEHPDPVVLVHGLGASKTVNWQTMSPLLANEGYCVFALTYGTSLPGESVGGLTPMEESAEELDTFVDDVLDATGAEQVDLVGHSEGTLMPQYWLQFLGGDEVTDDYVAVTPLYDGTVADPLPVAEIVDTLGARDLPSALVGAACGSCPQFISGSDYLVRMAEAGTRVDGVDYTTIMTRYDELVVPYTSGELEGATNIVVQDGCEQDLSDHLAIIFSERTGQLILNALDPENAQPVPCRVVLPLLGNEILSG